MAKNLNPVEHAVKRLQDGLQEADFDGAYRFLGDLDLDTVTANIDEFSSLRLRCLVAEVRDFFGDYAAAKEAIETVGRASFDKLHESLQLRTETEHAMAKQRIWAAIHLGYVFYRAHHYDKAAEVFTFCERFVREKLVTGSSKCLFTQSRIWYSVGLVHRQNYKYEIAKEAFIKSIEFAWSELQSKDAYDTPQKARETKNQPAKYLRARALTDFCVAKSLALGLGWIFFTESALEIARSFVIAAKILLAGTKDRIITGYVNVIYAGIQRSEHADDEQALGEAIKELQNSYNLFSKNDEHEMHAAYKMRAALELALAHLQGFQCGGLPDLNALNVAEDFAKEGESLAGSDERWMCNSLVLQSRIHRLRGRADLALDAARVALEKGNKEVFLRIDAWIAQGEARAASSPPDHRGAIDDFSKALDQGRQNPKVSAVCHLHLAKMYLALGDVRSAVAHFGDSEKASEFRNAFIRTLRSKVKAAITKSREEFKIHIEDKVTDATELEKDFHGFLTEWARKHSKNDQEAAGLLRINIKTFYDWRAKAGLSKKVDQDNPD